MAVAKIVKMYDPSSGTFTQINGKYASDYAKKGYTTTLPTAEQKTQLTNSAKQGTQSYFTPESGVTTTKPTNYSNSTPLGTNNTYIQDQMKALKDAQLSQQTASLKNARDTSLSNLSADRAKIAPAYYGNRNDIVSNAKQSSRNYGEFLAKLGLTSSGANIERLSNKQYETQGLVNQNKAKETNELLANDRAMTDVKNAYQNNLAAAQTGVESDYLKNYINQLNIDRGFNTQEKQQEFQNNMAQTEFQNAQQQQQLNNFLSTIIKDSNDYQAAKNRVLGDNDPSNDWQADYYDVYRNQKIAGIEQNKATTASEQAKLQAQMEQQRFENDLKQKQYELNQQKTNYDTSKPYYAPKTATTQEVKPAFTTNQTFSQLDDYIGSYLIAKDDLGNYNIDKSTIAQYLEDASNQGVDDSVILALMSKYGVSEKDLVTKNINIQETPKTQWNSSIYDTLNQIFK